MFLQDCDAFVVVREPMERMISEFNWLKTFGVDETLRPKIVESAPVCWSLVDVMNFNIEIQVTLEVGVEYKESWCFFDFYICSLLHSTKWISGMMFDVFEN